MYLNTLFNCMSSFEHIKQDGRRGVMDQMVEDSLFELFHGAQYAMAKHHDAVANHDVLIYSNNQWIQRTWLTNKKGCTSLMICFVQLSSASLATPAKDESYADYVFNIEKQNYLNRSNVAETMLFTSFAKTDDELFIVGRLGKRNRQHIYKMHGFLDEAEARLLDFETNQWEMKVGDEEDHLKGALYLSQYTMLVGPVPAKTLEAFGKCAATRMEFQMDD